MSKENLIYGLLTYFLIVTGINLFQKLDRIRGGYRGPDYRSMQVEIICDWLALLAIVFLCFGY